MRAGQLRHKITVSRATTVSDNAGGFTSSWATYAQPWAFVEFLNGREAMLGHALEAIGNYRITIRYNAKLQPTDQITLSDGKLLNVTSIGDPDGMRHWLVILASTGTATPQ
jgi:SPP1 family predicted phage head-tail adaptor